MRVSHPQVCLHEPEIPQNTGNIGRLCAATACRLHLVKPFGFSVDDKNLRRPGLDYWPFLDLEIHDNFDQCLERAGSKVAFFSKLADRDYTEVPSDTDLFVFGSETKGLPSHLREKYGDSFYKIPMFHSGVRSLNLSNSVAIVIYDQLSMRGLFQNAEKGSH